MKLFDSNSNCNELLDPPTFGVFLCRVFILNYLVRRSLNFSSILAEKCNAKRNQPAVA